MQYRRTADGIYRAYDGDTEVCTVTRIDKPYRQGTDKWFAFSVLADAYAPTREKAVAEHQRIAAVLAELKEAQDAFNAVCDKVWATMHTPPHGNMSSAWHCLIGGQENADDTVGEGCVVAGSADYYRLIISGFETNMGELDPSWGDPYTRNIEADQINKEGAFAPTEYEVLSAKVLNGSDTTAQSRLAYAEQVADEAGLDGNEYDALVVAVYNRGDKYLSDKVLVSDTTEGAARTLVHLRARGDKVIRYVTEQHEGDVTGVLGWQMLATGPVQLFARHFNEHVRLYEALSKWAGRHPDAQPDLYDAKSFAEWYMALQPGTPAYCQAVLGDFNRRTRALRSAHAHPVSGRIVVLWARQVGRRQWVAADEDFKHEEWNMYPSFAIADYRTLHLGYDYRG